PVQAEQLIATAERAPYGRGEDTLTDTKVRRTWQIGSERVRIGGRHWPGTLQMILLRAAEGLGVSGPVDAEFYKLLVYDQGSFFVGIATRRSCRACSPPSSSRCRRSRPAANSSCGTRTGSRASSCAAKPPRKPASAHFMPTACMRCCPSPPDTGWSWSIISCGTAAAGCPSPRPYPAEEELVGGLCGGGGG